MSENIDRQFVSQFETAEKLTAQNRLQEALEIYTALLERQPNHVGVLNNMGLVHEKQGQFNNSVALYKKCNDLMPNQVVLIHNLANAYTRLGQWSEALPLLEKIVHKDFDNERNSEKYALCLYNVKSKQEAREYIDSVITRYPQNRRLNRLLGRALLHNNAHVDGLKYLQKGAGVIEFDSDGVRYLN